jgi:hypothetical protein
MKSLCLASLLTVAFVQQAIALVAIPPKIGQSQAKPAYYYHGRYYPYHYHGRYYPYYYHGHYYPHRVWQYGRWHYY